MSISRQQPNQITGPNAGGPHQIPFRTPLAARFGQFWRWAASHDMAMTQHEAAEEARSAVEHTFGYVLEEVRAERAALGLPPKFEFVCLVHSHSTPYELGTPFLDAFTAGQPLALPHGSPLMLARDREQLYRTLLPLYESGEHDASYCDYSRTDATLLHIHLVHCETSAQQVAAPEPPPDVSGSNSPVHRTLDSLPVTGSSGGR